MSRSKFNFQGFPCGPIPTPKKELINYYDYLHLLCYDWDGTRPLCVPVQGGVLAHLVAQPTPEPDGQEAASAKVADIGIPPGIRTVSRE